MHLQHIDPALQVRLLNRNPAVKPSRPEQCLVQYLRTVRCRQDQEALGGIKSIHLRQKLVQGLLPFIISAISAGIPALSDCVNLIDENDTGRIFLCFIEQVAHAARADADKHFNEV